MYNLKTLYMKMYFDFIQFIIICIGPLNSYGQSQLLIIKLRSYHFTNVIGGINNLLVGIV